MALDVGKLVEIRKEAAAAYIALGFDDSEMTKSDVLKCVCADMRVAVINFKPSNQDGLATVLGRMYMYSEDSTDTEPASFDPILTKAVAEKERITKKYDLLPAKKKPYKREEPVCPSGQSNDASKSDAASATTSPAKKPEDAVAPSENQSPAVVEKPEAHGENLPAVQEAAKDKMVVGINKNRATALRINGIDIPNDLIYWYGIKKNGVVVDAQPYVGLKCVEYLASKMDILFVDPRANDPAVPVNQLARGIDFEVVKNPWVENEWGPKGVAVVRGFFRTKDGQVYSDLGTATSENTNGMQKRNLLEQAISRAIVRSGRMATHCNLCSVEEANLEISKDKVLVKGGLPNEHGEIIDAEFNIISQTGSG